jgi:hypothetical protein
MAAMKLNVEGYWMSKARRNRGKNEKNDRVFGFASALKHYNK